MYNVLVNIYIYICRREEEVKRRYLCGASLGINSEPNVGVYVLLKSPVTYLVRIHIL